MFVIPKLAVLAVCEATAKGRFDLVKVEALDGGWRIQATDGKVGVFIEGKNAPLKGIVPRIPVGELQDEFLMPGRELAEFATHSGNSIAVAGSNREVTVANAQGATLSCAPIRDRKVPPIVPLILEKANENVHFAYNISVPVLDKLIRVARRVSGAKVRVYVPWNSSDDCNEPLLFSIFPEDGNTPLCQGIIMALAANSGDWGKDPKEAAN